jgi:hypothetical protein
MTAFQQRHNQPQASAMLSAAFLLWCCDWARAHEGPPFPILVDRATADYVVSVWADPDIGEATFYVITEPRSASPGETSSSLEPPRGELCVEPANGRLARKTYPATQQAMRNRIHFLAEPYFDQQEMWSIGIFVPSSQGETSELIMEVEATPPGAGARDVLIYLFPFVLFGGLWTLGMVRRWRTIQAETKNRPSRELNVVIVGTPQITAK